MASPKVMSRNFEDMIASRLGFVALMRRAKEAFAAELIQTISRL